MPPLPKKNKDKKKIQLHKLCEEIENDVDTSLIINHFSNSFGSIIDYKYVIIYLPIIIYFIIILYKILNISEVNILDQSKSFTSEVYLGILSFFIMFVTYGLIDGLYQFTSCRGENISNFKIFQNCIYNSLYISLFVFFGYIFGAFLKNKRISGLDSHISVSSWKRNLSNNQNNLMVTFIFYIAAILYSNPITSGNIVLSRNYIC